MQDSKFSFNKRVKSFGYAFAGLRRLITQEHNMWVHCTVAVSVVVAGFMLHLSPIEWIVLIITIAGVLSAEAFNSSIEMMCDHVTPEHHHEIKYIKDMAAGAVLIMAIASIATGLILFVPKIIALFCSQP